MFPGKNQLLPRVEFSPKKLVCGIRLYDGKMSLGYTDILWPYKLRCILRFGELDSVLSV